MRVLHDQMIDELRAVRQQLAEPTAPPTTVPAPTPRTDARVPPPRVWPGDSAVLLVHGVGNAKQGDYTDVLHAVQAAAPHAAVYQLFYDQYNDWFNEKHNLRGLFTRLRSLFAESEGESDLSETLAEFTGDVIWPMFMNPSRAAIQLAYIAQIRQIIKDGVRSNRPANRPRLPSELKLSIVCHSLGCFHTYELLHTLVNQPLLKLRPIVEGVRFRSVVFIASPVQLIRTVAGRAGSLLPAGLATMADAGLRIPTDSGQGLTMPAVEKWVSVTGDLDPIGGHFVRKRADWAYTTVAGEQDPIVVQQQLIGTGSDESRLVAALKKSISTRTPPSLNNPHSWLGYINEPSVNIASWLA
jgi:hypothetical protein